MAPPRAGFGCLQVAGNRLAQQVGACESEEGWELRAAGAGFRPALRGNTGRGAFEAVRGEETDSGDFSVAVLKEPLQVITGRTLTIAGHVRTEGGAQVCVRGVCFSGNDQHPFRFRTGTPLAEAPAWQRVEAALAVPSGCDRLQVQVVAVLPSAQSSAMFDDIAVTDGGEATVLEQKLEESSQTLLGTGSSIAVRSTDAENPATLLHLLPSDVPAAARGLHRAGWCSLSDLGASVQATATGRSFAIAVEGASALEFVFPADAAGGLMVADAENFTPAAPDAEFTAQRVLLGNRLTRAMLQFESPVALRGELGNGLYRLHAPSPKVEIVLGFRAERREADDLLRTATRLQNEQPGKALDLVRDLTRKWPMDSELLSRANQLRAQILANQAAMLRRLEQDLDESLFFDTRGGFERVVQGVDELVSLYGDENLDARDQIMALRERANSRLIQIDGAREEQERERLQTLAQVFKAANRPDIGTLIDNYVARYLK
jgi:hypothetical protein